MGWRNRTGLLVFALLVVAAPYVLPKSFSNGIQIGIFALVTIGLSLLMGYAGQISLGHAAFYAIGAYTSGILTVRLGCSPWLALFGGLALSALVALAVGLPSLRLRGHYLAMATLAFGEIVNVVAAGWIQLTGGPSGFGNIPRWSLFGYELRPYTRDQAIFYFVWAWVILGLALALRLICSRTGRALRAIHDGEQAAQVLGVPTARLRIHVFVLSALYASFAGSLYAHIKTFLNPPPFGIERSILFLIIVVIGGMRTVWGAVLGTVALGLLDESLASLQQWRFLIYGVVLLGITMFVPQGLLLGARDLAVWLWGRVRRSPASPVPSLAVALRVAETERKR
jgi:branched-chain amino acid transport system permease protein